MLLIIQHLDDQLAGSIGLCRRSLPICYLLWTFGLSSFVLLMTLEREHYSFGVIVAGRTSRLNAPR
jgi:hypothetical protein